MTLTDAEIAELATYESLLEHIADEVNVKAVTIGTYVGTDVTNGNQVTLQVKLDFDTLAQRSKGLHTYKDNVLTDAPRTCLMAARNFFNKATT